MGGPEAVASADEIGRQSAVANGLVQALGGVVLGQEPAVREALAALIARGHVLLEGVPGTAKTLLVRSLSLALGLEFRRIQFTPDLMPSDITGVSLLAGPGTFTFRPGPIFGDLILADEINRAPAKTQAALLEAMQERSVTVDGTSHPLSGAFTVFATQNPVEFEGTYPLPEAELDRFLVKVVLGYPAADTAAFLASIGKQVTIVTEQREFGAELEVIHMYVQRKRFAQTDAEVLDGRPYKHPVTILTGTTVHEIRPGQVVLQDKDFARTTLEVDDVVTCHVRSDDGLFRELRTAGIQVINVGDSVRPRNLYWAVKEGSDFGLAVDEHLLFNPNHAILNQLPIDVLAQLTRDEAPSYSAQRLRELMDSVNGSTTKETVPA